MRVNFPDNPKNPLNVSPEQGVMLVSKEAALEGGLALTATVSREEVLRLLVGNPDQMRCDFCSTRVCVSLFPAATFVMSEERGVMGLEGNRSIGGFAACAPCREFVRAGNREALLKRSIRLLAQHPGARDAGYGGMFVFRKAIQLTHDGFFNNWTGEEVVLDG